MERGTNFRQRMTKVVEDNRERLFEGRMAMNDAAVLSVVLVADTVAAEMADISSLAAGRDINSDEVREASRRFQIVIDELENLKNTILSEAARERFSEIEEKPPQREWWKEHS